MTRDPQMCGGARWFWPRSDRRQSCAAHRIWARRRGRRGGAWLLSPSAASRTIWTKPLRVRQSDHAQRGIGQTSMPPRTGGHITAIAVTRAPIAPQTPRSQLEPGFDDLRAEVVVLRRAVEALGP